MYSKLAELCSWAYAIVWSFSFYPIIYLLISIKSSDSISFDYILLNILGYLCYTTSIYLQLFNQTVINQFKLRFHGNLPLLSIADVAYSVHGLMLNLLLCSQILYGNKIWGFKNKRVTFRSSRLTNITYGAFLIFCLYHWLNAENKHQFLEFALQLSYFKMWISFVKYLPQVMHNRKRKSMYGISKLQIFMDLSGCFFATTELVLKNKGSLLELISSNTGKLGIILVTFTFDVVYLAQFRIYTHTDPDNIIKNFNGATKEKVIAEV
ncbi:hypothetical protein CANARDRAFT_97920 [[Candida] arabinofermentans NRRL YB-2248]|uniref:Uncharacterized protein n=1 Tax=[Candida] arabinofermentans NRRL YB-2248 TaxID=983967 RepID=A0A1E4T749_9ASCO|nr:hypothetical protein CANARDRAFT_97920 [[Candida] arabinofermentans NRRL YB-2248]